MSGGPGQTSPGSSRLAGVGRGRWAIGAPALSLRRPPSSPCASVPNRVTGASRSGPLRYC